MKTQNASVLSGALYAPFSGQEGYLFIYLFLG